LSDPSEWIPLSAIQINQQIVSHTRHGYRVPYTFQLMNLNNDGKVKGNIIICNFLLADSFQIRWLVTSRSKYVYIRPKDVWSLDDVKIALLMECMNHTLLEDSFDTSKYK